MINRREKDQDKLDPKTEGKFQSEDEQDEEHFYTFDWPNILAKINAPSNDNPISYREFMLSHHYASVRDHARVKAVYTKQSGNKTTSTSTSGTKKISKPGDAVEVEAEQITKQVMEKKNNSASENTSQKQSTYQYGSYENQTNTSDGFPLIVRAEDITRKPEENTMTQESGGALETTASFEEQLAAAESGGAALDNFLLARLEQELGVSLGHVRVHTDSAADALARGVGALAFTHGHHIYFQQGKFAPLSDEGYALLVHELVHAGVQQELVASKNIARKGDEPKAPIVKSIIIFKTDFSETLFGALFGEFAGFLIQDKRVKCKAEYELEYEFPNLVTKKKANSFVPGSNAQLKLQLDQKLVDASVSALKGEVKGEQNPEADPFSIKLEGEYSLLKAKFDFKDGLALNLIEVKGKAKQQLSKETIANSPQLQVLLQHPAIAEGLEQGGKINSIFSITLKVPLKAFEDLKKYLKTPKEKIKLEGEKTKAEKGLSEAEEKVAQEKNAAKLAQKEKRRLQQELYNKKKELRKLGKRTDLTPEELEAETKKLQQQVDELEKSAAEAKKVRNQSSKKINDALANKDKADDAVKKAEDNLKKLEDDAARYEERMAKRSRKIKDFLLKRVGPKTKRFFRKLFKPVMRVLAKTARFIFRSIARLIPILNIIFLILDIVDVAKMIWALITGKPLSLDGDGGDGEENETGQEGAEGGTEKKGSTTQTESGGTNSGETGTGIGDTKTETGSGTNQNETGAGDTKTGDGKTGDGTEEGKGLDNGQPGTTDMDQARLEELFAGQLPAKRVLLDALTKDKTDGIHLDEDFVKRFLMLDFHGMAVDDPKFVKILEDIQKLDGETMMDRNKLLDRLQKMLNGEKNESEKESEKTTTDGKDVNTKSETKGDPNTTEGKEGTKNTTTDPSSSSSSTTQTNVPKVEPTVGGADEKNKKKAETDTELPETAEVLAWKEPSANTTPLMLRYFSSPDINWGGLKKGVETKFTLKIHYIDSHGIKRMAMSDNKIKCTFDSITKSNKYIFVVESPFRIKTEQSTIYFPLNYKIYIQH